VQRRRRKKAAPRNVFGSSSQPVQKSNIPRSSQSKSPRSRSRVAPPPSVPGSKIKVKDEIPKNTPEESTKISEEPAVESFIDALVEEGAPVEEVPIENIIEDNILENQLLGVKKREKIGLNNNEPKTSKQQTSGEETSGKSLKARQIIQDSMLKASIAAKEEKTRKAASKTIKTTPEPPKKPQRKFRNRNSSYQPANRARRLDRSRHMEYKYEMRGLLVDIGVAEEHRSNLLATIWARGERQTSKEAKEFIDEKHLEGIIDEEQMTSLEKVVDVYTVRR